MNVFGISYRFDNELQLTAEHLFNGIGDPEAISEIAKQKCINAIRELP